MKLSTLSILLGLGVSLPQLAGLLNPAAFRAAARRFPRSLPWGYALMGLGTLWFMWNLQREEISDFAAYKNLMLAGFGILGLGCCIYVKDFLAVRGLAVVLLMIAKLIVDTARWAETPWRLVLISLAYLWVVAGLWLTVSPWRLRDLIAWATATDERIRTTSVLRLALGLFLVGLGLTVFRG